MKKLLIIVIAISMLTGCISLTFVKVQMGDYNNTGNIETLMETATDQKTDAKTDVSATGL